MESKGLTGWFPCHIKPVRSGWYLVKGNAFLDGKTVMRFFNVEKQQWYWASYEYGFKTAGVRDHEQWCGMKKEMKWDK